MELDLKEEIHKEHSKKQAIRLARYIEEDSRRFADLMDLFLNGEYRVTQRAAWIVSHCAEKHPSLILPYLDRMIPLLSAKVHDAVKRNILRILKNVEVPEDLQGILFNACITILENAQEAIAIRTFSLTVAFNICQKHPDLTGELKSLIENQVPFESAAYISRARKILKKMNKRD